MSLCFVLGNDHLLLELTSIIICITIFSLEVFKITNTTESQTLVNICNFLNQGKASSYILRKTQNFVKSSSYFWRSLVMSKRRWWFRKKFEAFSQNLNFIDNHFPVPFFRQSVHCATLPLHHEFTVALWTTRGDAYVISFMSNQKVILFLGIGSNSAPLQQFWK